jgi:hypothetical protein
MALTTAEEVREIMSGNVMTDEQIDPFLLSGHLYLNSIYSGCTTMGNTLRREIERWFVAHMIASTGFNASTGGAATAEVKREKIGDAEIEYAASTYVPKDLAGLDSTPYGRMAIQLDTCGILAVAAKKKASIFAIPQFDNTDE